MLEFIEFSVFFSGLCTIVVVVVGIVVKSFCRPSCETMSPGFLKDTRRNITDTTKKKEKDHLEDA